MNKYISQQNNQNFVYPNYNLAEYDVDIIHNIYNNSVLGTLNSSSLSGTTSGLTLTVDATWIKNSSEPFVNNNDYLQIWSVHCMTPSKMYYKPWRLIGKEQSSDISIINYPATVTYSITPAMMGVASFATGTYYFEIRFIGATSVYPISFSIPVTI